MTEFADASEGSVQSSADHDRKPESNNSQFGLIDVVEAFTALRHEYRSQVRDTRSLAEQLKTSTRKIIELESKLSDSADKTPGNAQADAFCKTLIDIDIQLSRAVAAANAEDTARQARRTQRHESFARTLARPSWVVRFFAGSTIKALQELNASEPEADSAVTDGLTILLSKLREKLREHGIDRIETEGKPFDGERMRSIGHKAVDGIPSGHVSQQLAPAYLRDHRIIKYAEVRVAP